MSAQHTPEIDYPTRWAAAEVALSGGRWIVYRLTSRTTTEHLTRTLFRTESEALDSILKATGAAA